MLNTLPTHSPLALARTAAGFYLVTFVAGTAALFVRGAPGLVANLVANAAYLAVTLLFYELFKPVSRGLSLAAAFFSLAGIVISALAISGVARPPINNLVPFGFYCLLIGYLILRSTFLPHVLGGVMMIAGLGWLTFLFPALAARLRPYNMAPGVVGELALTLWLLVMGVNAPRWAEQARAASAAVPTATGAYHEH